MARNIGDPLMMGKYDLTPRLQVVMRIAPRGVPGIVMFATLAATMLFGHYKISGTMKEAKCASLPRPSLSMFTPQI